MGQAAAANREGKRVGHGVHGYALGPWRKQREVARARDFHFTTTGLQTSDSGRDWTSQIAGGVEHTLFAR